MKEGDVGRMIDCLRSDAAALAGEVDQLDIEQFTRWVIASITAAVFTETGASLPGRPTGAAGLPGPGVSEEVGRERGAAFQFGPDDLGREGTDAGGQSWPGKSYLAHSTELMSCVQSAAAGNAAAARRVAELLEVAGLDDLAPDWWHVAAALGDPDAADYVEGILNQTLSTGAVPEHGGDTPNLSPPAGEIPGAFPVSLDCIKLIRLSSPLAIGKRV